MNDDVRRHSSRINDIVLSRISVFLEKSPWDEQLGLVSFEVSIHVALGDSKVEVIVLSICRNLLIPVNGIDRPRPPSNAFETKYKSDFG